MFREFQASISYIQFILTEYGVFDFFYSRYEVDRWPSIITKRIIGNASTLFFFAIIIVLISLIPFGYRSQFTGFGETIEPPPGIVGAKTLWDWLELIIFPLGLAFVGYVLQKAIRKNDTLRNQVLEEEKALAGLYDRLAKYLLDTEYEYEEEFEGAREFMRVQVQAVVQGRSAKGKGEILKFLYETKLISSSRPVINLRLVNFQNANIDYYQFWQVDVNHANFQNLSMKRGNISGSFASGCTFANSFLRQAAFDNTNFEYVLFSRAHMYGASFRNCSLIKTRFHGAYLRKSRFEGDAARADFMNSNLVKADFSGADLWRTNFGGTNLSGAKFDEGSPIEANFYGANLRGASMRYAELIGADFSRANMAWVDLSYADLSEARISRYRLRWAKNIEGAILPKGITPPRVGLFQIYKILKPVFDFLFFFTRAKPLS